MKYKRLLVFVTSMIFVSALIICFFAMFKTAEIIVNVKTVNGSNEQVTEKVEESLSDAYGKNLLFISTEDIKNQVNSLSSYAKVIEVVKHYPNKLEIVVEERLEKFSVEYNGEYYAIDGELHVLSKKNVNENNVDNNPNVLLKFDVADIDANTLQIGSTLKIYDEKTLNYLLTNADKLYLNRGDISSIEITVKKEKVYFRRLTLKMREAIVINIDKADIKTTEKIEKALEFYSLSPNKGEALEYFVNILAETGEIVVTL